MEGQTSVCRSFGSNHHPLNQSRKISIGVIDGSLVGMKTRATKVQEVAVPNAEGLYCDLGNSIVEKMDKKNVANFTKSKQCEARQQFDSPRVSTRSLHLDASIVDTGTGTKRMFISPASWGKPSNSNGVKEAPATYSVNVFADGTSILQSGESERKFDNVNFQNKGGKDITAKRVEELLFPPAINVEMVEKVGTDYEASKTGKETEILRMKLREILGTVSSPNNHQSISRNPDKGVVNSNTEQSLGQKSSRAVKSAKSSNSIETNSEGPEQTTTRPRTRYSFRKRAPTKLLLSKAKNDACSSDKFKRQEESVFIFEPGLRRSPHDSVHGSSSMSEKSKIRALKIKPSKICATDKCDAYQIDLETFRPKAQLSHENTSLLRNITDKLPDCDNKPENVEEYCKPGTLTKENFDQSLMENMTEPPKDHNGPLDVEQREDAGNACSQNSLDPHSYLQSPTLKIDNLYSSPSLSPKTSHVLKSPALARRETVVGDTTSLFWKLQSRKKVGDSNAKDFAEEDNDFIFSRKASNARERDVEGDRSEFSCEKRIESSGGSGQRATEICTTEKVKFTIHSLKKLNLIRSPQKNCWNEEPSEQSQEDELERAVKLFCMGLEKIKSKMKSETVKKSSEILLSVADETDLQLQNVRSQIETDVVKLTNLCKSKRKLLETTITEQQDQLKFIHEKFKQDVNQHLQYCKSTLHELEVQQVEIKGAMEKRRASHRNVLLQVEEAFDERLNDSQRRIRGIQELARRKMLHLTTTIAECLEEG